MKVESSGIVQVRHYNIKVIMKIVSIFLVMLLQVWLVQGYVTVNRQREPVALYRLLRDIGITILGSSGNDPYLLRRAASDNKLQDKIPSTTKFPCQFIGTGPDAVKEGSRNSEHLPRGRSLKIPKSVHELRPGDIDVIGAMGDSLTAGNGGAATNLFQVLVENRGISWSIGGQGTWRKYLTLPNIIKVFNPNLIGFSLSDSYGHQRAAQLNVAELGAMSRDLMHMANQLVWRMKNDPRVNIKKDWKLITLLMGPNDFCLDFCYVKDITKSAEIHRRELLTALKILKRNLPRTLVSIVIAPDVELLKNFTGTPPLCETTHLIECPCFFGLPNSGRLREFVTVIHEWQQVQRDMQDHPDFNDSDDFAVVFQPFVQDIQFPKINGKTDFSLMSTDCFHFSQKGYARASNALWNNMLEPIGQKSTNWGDTWKRFLCPTNEFPFFFTKKNTFESNRELLPPDESNLLKRSIKPNNHKLQTK